MTFSGPDQVVTSTEKVKLLGFLRRTHGKADKPVEAATRRRRSRSIAAARSGSSPSAAARARPRSTWCAQEASRCVKRDRGRRAADRRARRDPAQAGGIQAAQPRRAGRSWPPTTSAARDEDRSGAPRKPKKPRAPRPRASRGRSRGRCQRRAASPMTTSRPRASRAAHARPRPSASRRRARARRRAGAATPPASTRPAARTRWSTTSVEDDDDASRSRRPAAPDRRRARAPHSTSARGKPKPRAPGRAGALRHRRARLLASDRADRARSLRSATPSPSPTSPRSSR